MPHWSFISPSFFYLSLSFWPLFLQLSLCSVFEFVIHSAHLSVSALRRGPPPWLWTSPVWLRWCCSICWFWGQECGLPESPGRLRGRAMEIGPKWCSSETGISACWLGFSPWLVCWSVGLRNFFFLSCLIFILLAEHCCCEKKRWPQLLR